jgi:hypothetical protein
VSSNVVSGVFYGYPAELLSAWCLVSLETAIKWKRGETEPSPQALRLFELHRDRRILGPEWDGWVVNKAHLVDPENNATTQGQLRAYYHVYQLCHALMRDNDAAKAEFNAIMRLAG